MQNHLKGQYRSYRNGVIYTYTGSWSLDAALLTWTAEVFIKGELRGQPAGRLLVKPGMYEEMHVRNAIKDAIDHSPDVI